MSTTTTVTDRAAALAAGLRALAAMFTEHPELAAEVPYTLSAIPVFVSPRRDGDVRARIVAFARAGMACGATVTESNDSGSDYAGVDLQFGPVRLNVYSRTEQVHAVTRRTVEQVDDQTCRVTEYTPRPLLADLGGDAEGRAA